MLMYVGLRVRAFINLPYFESKVHRYISRLFIGTCCSGVFLTFIKNYMMSELQTLIAPFKTFFFTAQKVRKTSEKARWTLEGSYSPATEGFASVADLPVLCGSCQCHRLASFEVGLANIIKLPSFGGEGKGRRLAVPSADWLLSGPFVYDDDACQTVVFSICANAGFFRLRV